MAATAEASATRAVGVYAVEGDAAQARSDQVVVEEPLEIKLRGDFADEPTVSITMRTPTSVDEDYELALGFLFGEGVIRNSKDVASIEQKEPNVVVVGLAAGVSVSLRQLSRNVYTTSACGLCGKTAIDALAATPTAPLPSASEAERVDPALLHRLPETLRAAQAAFSATGGLHAAGLFDRRGQLLLCREDVGRHNAVDKLFGACLRQSQGKALTLSDTILCVSGRASFELVQKARMAGVPIFVAVGAPSSLAVALCREASLTLVGFARNGRYNVYAAPERLALRPASGP